MFARITKFKMKPSSVAAARKRVEDMQNDILALPGMIQFINVMNNDGSGYVVSLTETRELSEENADRVRAIWGKFAEYLEKTPVPEGYDVIHNWVPERHVLMETSL